MTDNSLARNSLARRDVIKAAGAGLATSLLAAATAQAQTPAAAQTAEFCTAEYTAKKGDVSLAIYRKRVGAPGAGARKQHLPGAGRRHDLGSRVQFHPVEAVRVPRDAVEAPFTPSVRARSTPPCRRARRRRCAWFP